MLKDLNEYDYWANAQILNQIQIHRDLEQVNSWFYHILEANAIWYARLVDEKIDTNVWNDVPDLATFNEHLEKNYLRLKDYIRDKSEEDLKASIGYTNSKNQTYINSIQDILFHIFNHGTHHRAQILSLWNHLGIARPSLDYIAYKRG